MRHFVVGLGYVGSELARRLLARGDQVYGLRRHVALLPDGVIPVGKDVSREFRLDEVPAPDCVFYLVAAEATTAEAYETAYVRGTRNLLAAMRDAGWSGVRVLYASSTGVYGQQHGEWVDEDSMTEPPNFRGRAVLAGEKACRASGHVVSCVRFGGIYGPGRDRLVHAVRRGEARFYEGGPHYTNRIHRDDAAGILLHLAGLAKPPEVVNGVDLEPADHNEVILWLAGREGVSPQVFPKAARPSEGKRVSSRRLVSTGYSFCFPTFREGYANLTRVHEK